MVSSWYTLQFFLFRLFLLKLPFSVTFGGTAIQKYMYIFCRISLWSQCKRFVVGHYNYSFFKQHFTRSVRSLAPPVFTHLHDLAIFSSVQRVQLVGFEVVWRDGCIRRGSTQFTFPLINGFAVSGLSAAQRVGQRWLQWYFLARLALATGHCFLNRFDP